MEVGEKYLYFPLSTFLSLFQSLVVVVDVYPILSVSFLFLFVWFVLFNLIYGNDRVLTHFPPADTYTAQATADQTIFSVKNFRDKDRSRNSLYVFGHGDGGLYFFE